MMLQRSYQALTELRYVISIGMMRILMLMTEWPWQSCWVVCYLEYPSCWRYCPGFFRSMGAKFVKIANSSCMVSPFLVVWLINLKYVLLTFIYNFTTWTLQIFRGLLLDHCLKSLHNTMKPRNLLLCKKIHNLCKIVTQFE